MPASIVELLDIIASVNSYVAGDKAKAKELAKALRADAKDVAQHLINVGAGQKAGEVGGRVDELQGKVEELTGALEQKETEITELRTRAPDAATLDAQYKAKYEPKLKEAREKAEKAEQNARTRAKDVGVRKFIAALTAPDEQGMRVDAQWAEKVVAAEFGDRFRVKDDYALDVFQIGEDTPYDGDTEDARIAALARDARKTVPATYVVSNADSGGGVRNGSGGGTGSGKTLPQIIDEKRRSGQYAM